MPCMQYTLDQHVDQRSTCNTSYNNMSTWACINNGLAGPLPLLYNDKHITFPIRSCGPKSEMTQGHDRANYIMLSHYQWLQEHNIRQWLQEHNVGQWLQEHNVGQWLQELNQCLQDTCLSAQVLDQTRQGTPHFQTQTHTPTLSNYFLAQPNGQMGLNTHLCRLSRDQGCHTPHHTAQFHSCKLDCN